MSNEALLDEATQCVALRVRRLSRLVTRHYEHALREVGLTPGQFSLLEAVALKEPLPTIALARMFDLDESTLSRNLGPLIDSALLAREAGSAGGKWLRITRKGRDVLHRALPEWKKAQAEAIALLGEDVVPRLDEMIAAMAKH